MLIDTAHARLLLERGQSSRLSGAGPLRLRSVSGTLWITIDHDPRDIVLEPGQHVELRSAEPLLICALGGPAVLELR